MGDKEEYEKPKDFAHGLELIYRGIDALDFSFMNISHSHLEDLLLVMRERNGTSKLKFNNNNIGDPGAVLFADYLTDPDTCNILEVLELTKNYVGDEGAHALANALRTNTSLYKLSLGSNLIKSEGANALALALKSNNTLQFLKLDGNYILPPAAAAFVSMLEGKPDSGISGNTCLTSLNINCLALEAHDSAKIIFGRIDSALKRNKVAKEAAISEKAEHLTEILSKKQSNISTASVVKGPWRRAKLMIVGQGRAGKTATVRSILDLPFDNKLESTIVSAVTEVNVRKRGWKTANDDGLGLDNATAVALAVAGTRSTNKTNIEMQASPKANGNPSNQKKNYTRNELARLSPQQIRAAAKGHLPKPPQIDAAEQPMAVAPSGDEFRKLSPAEKKKMREVIRKQREEEVSKTTFEPLLDEQKVNNIKQGRVFKGVNRKLPSLRFSIWDLGGQTVFHTVHHLFISSHAIYLLVFNMTDILGCNVDSIRDGTLTEEDVAGHLQFWIKTLKIHAPEAPIVIVGTFLDSIEKITDDIDGVLKEINVKLLKLLPLVNGNGVIEQLSIVRNQQRDLAFFPVDNYTKKGVQQLKRVLESTAEEQEFINIPVDVRWLRCLDILLEETKSHFLERPSTVRPPQVHQQVDQMPIVAPNAGLINDNNNPPPAPIDNAQVVNLLNPALRLPPDQLQPRNRQPDDVDDPADWGIDPNDQDGLRMHAARLAMRQDQNLTINPTEVPKALTLAELISKVSVSGNFRGWVPFNKVESIAKRFGIDSEKEVQKMLVMFHKLGALFYIDSSELLRTVVTTDVQWLIHAVGKVIRDTAHHTFDEAEISRRNLQADVDMMFGSGLVTHDLLDYFWLIPDERAFLVEFMKKTLLMNVWKWKIESFSEELSTKRRNQLLDENHEEINNEIYLVPSLLPIKSDFDNGLKMALVTSESFRAVFDFASTKGSEFTFLPEGIFERLISLVIDQASRDPTSRTPTLERDICKVTVGAENEFFLYREEDKIICSILHEKWAQYDMVIVDKMLLKIKEDLSLGLFTWTISVEDVGSKSLIPLAIAKEKSIQPWFTKDGDGNLAAQLTKNSGLSLDNFMDSA